MYDNQTFVCFDDGTSWPFKDGYRLMAELGRVGALVDIGLRRSDEARLTCSQLSSSQPR
jgi:hypothetical protein